MKRATGKGFVQNLLSLVVVSGISTLTSLSVANASLYSAADKQLDPVNDSKIRCCTVYYDDNGYRHIYCINVRGSSCPDGYYEAIKIRKPSYFAYSNPRYQNRENLKS